MLRIFISNVSILILWTFKHIDTINSITKLLANHFTYCTAAYKLHPLFLTPQTCFCTHSDTQNKLFFLCFSIHFILHIKRANGICFLLLLLAAKAPHRSRYRSVGFWCLHFVFGLNRINSNRKMNLLEPNQIFTIYFWMTLCTAKQSCCLKIYASEETKKIVPYFDYV